MSAKYKSPSFLLPNELNTSANPANDTGVNSLYSMNFDASSSQYVDTPQINLGSTNSISFWINRSSTAQGTLFGDPNGSSNYSLYIFGGKIYFRLGNNDSGYWENTPLLSGVLSDGNWHHHCLTRDGVTLNYYIDGVLQTNVTVNTLNASAGTNTTIENIFAKSDGSAPLSGNLDEVAIFNKALNSTEIAALYDGTGSNIRPSNLMASNLNPLAYYPLGEQAQNSGKLPDTTTNEWQFPNGVLQDYVMDFNGGDNVNIVDAPSSNGTQTLSMWINTSTSGNNGGLFTIVSNGATSDYWSVALWNSNIHCSTANTGSSKQSTTNVADGNWHNIIFVKSSSVCTHMYIDGNLQTLSNGSWSGPINTPQAKIGSGNYSNTEYYFTGKISNVVLWTSDQSSNKDNIYNNGSPQTSYTVSPQNWWKLNADSVFAPSAPNYTTALDFTSPDLISINSPITIDTTQPYSISAWVYLDSTGTEVIIAGNTSGGTSNFVVPLVIKSVSGSFAAIATHQENSSGIFRQSNSIAKSELTSGWSHIVLVKDGVNCSFFYNGQPYGTASFSTTPPATVELTTIGKGFNNWYLNGRLSNLAIFDSGLTASQISTLFNFGTPETNISFSPQAWWKLNDQTAITDSSGNGNTGTNNGAANFPSGIAVTPVWKIPTALPITTTPNYTTALDFVANGDTISIPDSNDLDLSGTDFSISFWVNANSISSSQMILQKYSGTTGWAIYNKSTSNSLEFYQAGAFFSLDTNSIDNNIWSHYVVTANVSASEYKIYKNGSLTNTISRTVNITSSTQPLYIGSKDGTGFYYNGLLSNIAIYNSTLLPSQVSTIYNNGTPETAISFSPISWWKLDTGGSTITDYGSGGNNGTNNGASPATSDVLTTQPVNGVSTTLPSTALQQSDLQFDSPYSNYSLSFDGTGDTVAISNLQSSFTNLSISFWIKSGVDASNAYVFARGVSQFLIFQNSTNASLKYRVKTDAGTINYDAIGGNILDNNWHHCVMVVDTSNNFIKVYEDGSEVATTTTVGNIETSTSTAYLASANSGAPFKSGHFDELSMFDSVLTSAQVLEIYNNGRPKDLTTFSGTTPVSWWRLGENAYFDNNSFIVPNSISGAPNGTGSGTITTMISADAPGTYANGVGENLDILDRVGDAALSTSNSQSYNMIPSDISPYVPQYVGKQIANNFSMTFDAASLDYINVGIPNFLSAKSTFTISLWFNTNDIDSQTTLCMVGGSASQLWGLSKFQDDLIIYGGSSTKYYRKNTLFNINTWYNLIVVYDGSQSNANRYKAYIDGSLLTSPTVYGTIDTTTPTFTTDFNIGRIDYAAASYFNGKIDEVAIFDTALNAGQIYNDIYQPTSTATNQTADLVNNPNLPNPVAWYRMGD